MVCKSLAMTQEPNNNCKVESILWRLPLWSYMGKSDRNLRMAVGFSWALPGFLSTCYMYYMQERLKATIRY